MFKSPFFILFFTLFHAISFAQTPQDSLTQKLTALCNSTKVPGFAVAVVSKDKVLYQNEFGFADLKEQRPYQIHTIQNIGSTSKTVVGVAIMKAVEQGKLTLETPINAILPFNVIHPKYPKTPITVKHLATHTSGIHDSFKFYLSDYVAEQITKKNLKGAGFLEKIHLKTMAKNTKIPLGDYLKEYLIPKGKFYKKGNFKTQPGTTYNYSNAGAGLAAYVVEIAVGQPFEDYTKQYIFDPLKMTETGWFFKDVDMNKHATLYTPKKVAVAPRYTLNTYPDGGLLTNIEDLSRYASAMLRGQLGESELLSQESFQIMMQDYLTKVKKENKNQGYGVFWDIAKSGAVGHSGSDPGVNSLLYLFPDQNIGILFIVNMSLDDTKQTMLIYQQIWSHLRAYSKTILDKDK